MPENKSPVRRRREALQVEFPPGRVLEILLDQVEALAAPAKRTTAFKAMLVARGQALAANPKTAREKHRDGEV